MDVKREMKLRSWAKDMEEQKNSGLSREAWCKIHGIPSSTFDYRCSVVCKAINEKLEPKANDNQIALSGETKPEPVFAKVNLTKSETRYVGINIRLGEAEINIAPDSNPEHIKLVLEAFRHA